MIEMRATNAVQKSPKIRLPYLSAILPKIGAMKTIQKGIDVIVPAVVLSIPNFTVRMECK